MYVCIFIYKKKQIYVYMNINSKFILYMDLSIQNSNGHNIATIRVLLQVCM